MIAWLMSKLRMFDYVEGWWCEDCQDVHAEQEKCPRALERFCLDCERLTVLDRFFRCGKCGSRSVIVQAEASAAEARRRIRKHETQKILKFRTRPF